MPGLAAPQEDDDYKQAQDALIGIENYIPLLYSDVRNRLLEDTSAFPDEASRKQFKEFCEALSIRNTVRAASARLVSERLPPLPLAPRHSSVHRRQERARPPPPSPSVAPRPLRCLLPLPALHPAGLWTPTVQPNRRQPPLPLPSSLPPAPNHPALKP